MVNLVKATGEEFYRCCKKQNIYCIGAGKYLDRYCRESYYLEPVEVIDNNVIGFKILNNREFRVKKLDEVIDSITNDAVIIITSSYYMEILEQIDEEDSLDGINCYIPYPYFTSGEGFPVRESDDKIINNGPRRIKENAFLIWERRTEIYNAARKAPYDIRMILEKYGYKAIEIHNCSEELQIDDWRFKRTKGEWDNAIVSIKNGSIVVLQHPFTVFQSLRRKALKEMKSRDVKFVVFLHDLEEVRKYIYTGYMADEEKFAIDIADILIVHNDEMKRVLLQKGITESKIVVLKMFDYLCSEKEIPVRHFAQNVIVAGNLDVIKNPHLKNLKSISDVTFELYGAGFDEKCSSENVFYNGSFLAEKLPNKLKDGFGLVWGGDSLERCSGDVGEYLRFNNPHKLSLYLAAGLPVIVWKEAATAQFVLNNNVGFCINSLFELKERISSISEKDYNIYAKNASIIGQKLRNGEYTVAALDESERRINAK